MFQKKSVLGLQPVIAVNFGFQDLLSKSMDGTQRVWQFTFRDSLPHFFFEGYLLIATLAREGEGRPEDWLDC